MLAHWFERSGIGQALAPDPGAREADEDDESRSAFWQILAPDDNFLPPRAPPAGAFPPAGDGSGQRMVRCVHCHSWTPSEVAGGSGGSRSSSSGPSAPAVVETVVPPRTPSTPANNSRNNPNNSSNNNNNSDLDARVLSACRETARFMKSPKPERKNHDKFLRLCSSTQALQPKLLNRMRSMVENHSYRDAYLLRVRATKMGVTAPDGYTSLQCAAYANNVAAAGLILELARGYSEAKGDPDTYGDLHLDRDLYGMTALHIAGERGNLEMVQFLLPLYEFPPGNTDGTTDGSNNDGNNDGDHADSSSRPASAMLSGLVDLGGQTAFGRAMTSPVPKAKKHQRTLEKSLYSRNDLSIFGESKPSEERAGFVEGLGISYGTAEMPGLRGYMEDAVSVATWQQGPQPMALFAVCDGHGDHGRVSNFVASRMEGVLRACLESHEPRGILLSGDYWTAVWTEACLRLDAELKDQVSSEGGSTGVFALVTPDEIVVANVGDSRCVLARTAGDRVAEEAPVPGEHPNEAETEAKGNGEADHDNDHDHDAPPAPAAVEAIALSEDHSPGLPGEAERIAAAGFRTEAVRVAGEDGKESLIHKVVGNEASPEASTKTSTQLAVSRAFGDFEFKANDTLPAAGQAVVAVPGVVVRARDPQTDRLLVLACDGIWDVASNQTAAGLVLARWEGTREPRTPRVLSDAADALLLECLGRESRDNLSAVLVSLGAAAGGPQAVLASPEAGSLPPRALAFGSPGGEA